jgi:hypothetical protein
MNYFHFYQSPFLFSYFIIKKNYERGKCFIIEQMIFACGKIIGGNLMNIEEKVKKINQYRQDAREALYKENPGLAKEFFVEMEKFKKGLFSKRELEEKKREFEEGLGDIISVFEERKGEFLLNEDWFFFEGGDTVEFVRNWFQQKGIR